MKKDLLNKDNSIGNNTKRLKSKNGQTASSVVRPTEPIVPDRAGILMNTALSILSTTEENHLAQSSSNAKFDQIPKDMTEYIIFADLIKIIRDNMKTELLSGRYEKIITEINNPNLFSPLSPIFLSYAFPGIESQANQLFNCIQGKAIQFFQGQVNLKWGRGEEAFRHFHKAFPGEDNQIFYFRLSMTYHFLGEYVTAIKYMHQAIAINPLNPYIWFENSAMLITIKNLYPLSASIKLLELAGLSYVNAGMQGCQKIIRLCDAAQESSPVGKPAKIFFSKILQETDFAEKQALIPALESMIFKYTKEGKHVRVYHVYHILSRLKRIKSTEKPKEDSVENLEILSIGKKSNIELSKLTPSEKFQIFCTKKPQDHREVVEQLERITGILQKNINEYDREMTKLIEIYYEIFENCIGNCILQKIPQDQDLAVDTTIAGNILSFLLQSGTELILPSGKMTLQKGVEEMNEILRYLEAHPVLHLYEQEQQEVTLAAETAAAAALVDLTD